MKGINPNTGKSTTRYEFCGTRKSRELQDAADRLLAKSGFFARTNEQSEDVSLDPDAIATGHLRPILCGRP